MKARKRLVWPPPHFRARRILKSRKKPPSSILFEVKPIPEQLIQRLKKAASQIEKRLGKMQNIDHRQNMELSGTEPKSLQAEDTLGFGRRVRQMNIARNFPTVELAIKRKHWGTAQQSVDYVRKKVQDHNQNFKNENYILLEPIAEAISDNLIAMPKLNAPSVSEILREDKLTPRATEFFSTLKQAFGTTKADLNTNAEKVLSRTGIYVRNLWLLGFKEGKFVFMAMPDVI